MVLTVAAVLGIAAMAFAGWGDGYGHMRGMMGYDGDDGLHHMDVITSYSIHYTKLYEVRHFGTCPLNYNQNLTYEKITSDTARFSRDSNFHLYGLVSGRGTFITRRKSKRHPWLAISV